MDKKRILILAPMGCGGESLVSSARKLDLKITVATCQSVYETYADEFKKSVDDFLFLDYGEEERAIDAVIDYAKDVKIDGVVAGFEFSSSMAVRIAHKLGLPTNDPYRADACRKKHMMYRTFKAHGVPMAETYECSTVEECLAAASHMALPVIMKPSADAGSLNVFTVSSPDEIKSAFEKIRSKQSEMCHKIKLSDVVIVQEFMRGKEFSVEVVAWKQEMEVLSVVDKITTDGPCFAELGHTLPSCLDACVQDAVAGVAKKAAAAVGIRNGVAHVEVKLTETGPRVVEIGARLPGDKIVDLLELALGIDEAAAYIKAALGEEPNITPTKKQYVAIRFKTPPKKGRVKKYIGVDEIRRAPAIYELELYKAIHDEVGDPKSNLDRVGHVIAVGQQYAEAKLRGDRALSRLEVTVEA